MILSTWLLGIIYYDISFPYFASYLIVHSVSSHASANMQTLVVDTETIGLPSSFSAACSDTQAWPRIVEIAWIVLDDSLNKISSSSFVIRPDNFEIPSEASSIHRITTEWANDQGKPLRFAMACLAEDISEVDLLVAHNIDFDYPVINCELIRCSIASSISLKQRYCTMKSTASLCRIPGANGFKWPRLEELYNYLFDRTPEASHSALHDASATSECFIELNRRGLV